MGIDNARYHGWNGKLRSPWRSMLAIVGVALRQVLRRKSYWLVLALGLLNFLLFFSLIYAKTQFPVANRASHNRLLEAMDFSVEPPPDKESGYVNFMNRQGLVVMILLAFSGSLIVGSDFRMGSMPFYLSRRIDRRHYIVGKLLAVSAVILLITALPALILFVEYGLLTSSTEYFVEQWRIPVSVVGYALLMCTVLSIWLVTLAAYLQRMAPIAITWSSLFVLLAAISSQLRRVTGDRRWELLDPWRDIRFVGRWAFGFLESPEERTLALQSLAILSVVCILCLAALTRRVRAVEVVE